MRARRFLAASLLLTAACGGLISPLAGGDGGGPGDAGEGAPAPKDSDAGGASTTLDAAPAFDDGAPVIPDPDPLAACDAGTRDVFYVYVAGYPGPFSHGEQIFTNLDSNWQVSSAFFSSYDFLVGPINTAADDLQVGSADGGPLTPGVYPLGPGTGAIFELALDGEGCSVTSGSMTVLDAQSLGSDAGVDLPSSLLLSYSVECEGYGNTIPVQGCLRYAQSPPPEPVSDAGAGDGGILSRCTSGGDVIYAEAQGQFGGFTGARMITSATGTWSASTNPLFELSVSDLGLNPWQIDGELASVAPGTYTVTGDDHSAPWLAVEVDGTGCSSVPTGTFTLVDVETSYDQISKLLMSFDLVCGSTGTLHGCASFGQ